MICAYQACSKEFPPSEIHLNKRFCSFECRRKAWRDARRDKTAKERALHPKPKKTAKPKRKRLLCVTCGMAHRTDKCPRSKEREVVKQFGTVVNGRYLPPPGVRVRYIELPHEVFGEELTAMLKLEKEALK